LPFGPYLALGALIWMFFGEKFVQWYFQFINPG
jgi:prepilin signal peptidase PulO-like enzyme (type II secretory pathway)